MNISQRNTQPSKAGRVWQKIGIFLIAVGLLAASYFALQYWLVNRSNSEGKTTVVAPLTHSPDEEGKDETPVPQDALANYTVAADQPRALYIDKIGVKSRILPMGVNANGSVQAPINIFDAGWYTSSAKPGDTGASFIDAHASGATREGLFAYLDTLAVGDTLQIEKGDTTKLTYRVVHIETVPLDKVDMAKALTPYGGATKGLNLMTCTGTWIEASQTYDKRVIVYTEQVEA